jgi:hypothetical protein
MYSNQPLLCMKCNSPIEPNGATPNARLVADCLNCSAVNLLAEYSGNAGTYHVIGVIFPKER